MTHLPKSHPVFDSVSNGESKRMDCPSCGGKNSFSVSKLDGICKYYCFRASCGIKGATDYEHTLADVKSGFSALVTGNRVQYDLKFRLEDYFIRGIGPKECRDYLKSKNCMEAYEKGYFDVMYDPKQNRLLFMVKDDSGKYVTAIGRAIHKNIIPKTLNYGRGTCKIPFTCGIGDILVIVEDCASACSIARLDKYKGMALTGTNLKDSYLSWIIDHGYKHIIVALDKDASKKAIDMRNMLLPYVDKCDIWFLERDLKDISDKLELEHD